jgi:hypothetical protein
MAPAIRSRKVVCRLWKSDSRNSYSTLKRENSIFYAAVAAQTVVGVVHAPLFLNRYRLHTALVSTATHGRALMNINYRDRGEKPYRTRLGVQKGRRKRRVNFSSFEIFTFCRRPFPFGDVTSNSFVFLRQLFHRANKFCSYSHSFDESVARQKTLCISSLRRCYSSARRQFWLIRFWSREYQSCGIVFGCLFLIESIFIEWSSSSRFFFIVRLTHTTHFDPIIS